MGPVLDAIGSSLRVVWRPARTHRPGCQQCLVRELSGRSGHVSSYGIDSAWTLREVILRVAHTSANNRDGAGPCTALFQRSRFMVVGVSTTPRSNVWFVSVRMRNLGGFSHPASLIGPTSTRCRNQMTYAFSGA